MNCETLDPIVRWIFKFGRSGSAQITLSLGVEGRHFEVRRVNFVRWMGGRVDPSRNSRHYVSYFKSYISITRQRSLVTSLSLFLELQFVGLESSEQLFDEKKIWMFLYRLFAF